MQSLGIVKMSLVAGVAGALLLTAGGTSIAATRDDPGVGVVASTYEGGDDKERAAVKKKTSKETKAKKKGKFAGANISASYAFASRSSIQGRSAPRRQVDPPPRGRLDLSRDLLADGRP